MSYVGADAQRLGDLRAAVTVGADDVALRRRRVAALFAEADEVDVVGPRLSAIESELSATGCEIGAAATVAGADAAAGGQQGWRARMGIVDDALLDVLWVNDLSRVFTGRDINTDTQVGIGGRLASGVFLIPFTKIAKGTKVLKLGDEAVEVGAQAAGRAASTAIRSSEDVRTVLNALEKGDNAGVRKVSSVDELDELFARLSREGQSVPIGHGGPSVLLPDGTRISRRPTSGKRRAGGPTIDVRTPDHQTLKVHIHPWPPQ